MDRRHLRTIGAFDTSKQTPFAKKRAHRREVAGRLAVYGAMLAFCLGFWALVAVGCSRVAHADDCTSIRDPDERHMCMALEHRLRSECEFIKRPDLRQECRIRVERR